MEQVLPFLEGMFYIATTEGDQPHLRIFDAAGILDGHLYIGTKSNKQVYAQIEKNPKVEIYVFSNLASCVSSLKLKLLPTKN